MSLRVETAVQIQAGDAWLNGDLAIPEGATGLVIFAHGSGSSRLSPRNRYVARELQAAGLGTLLFDLLTEAEDRVYDNRFNIDLLAQRLALVTGWVQDQPVARGLPLGYFGASTGAAAALIAAAELPSVVKAVVSRGGRPDLAAHRLAEVKAATLLIVGAEDRTVAALNRAAFQRLNTVKRLELVPRATHLFEEPGTLEEVARLAAGWFREHLGGPESAAPGSLE